MYKSPTKNSWKGRTDPLDGEDGNRWHHIIKILDLSSSQLSGAKSTRAIAFLGFCCDEGVRRNLGRVGARNGPTAIRKSLANLAVHFDSDQLALYDAGDVICQGEHMESAQEMLGNKVAELLKHGFQPIVLGGGHEIAFGHFQGIHRYTQATNKKTAIINLDAHFDLRTYIDKGSSGTPFLQITELLEKSQEPLKYLVLGINEAANTKALFNTASKLGVNWMTAESMTEKSFDEVKSMIDALINDCDKVYLTVDMDAFNVSIAPGVSAPAPHGVPLDLALQILRHIAQSDKLLSVDFAEVNPELDIDNRTSKLAAHLVYQIIKEWASAE